MKTKDLKTIYTKKSIYGFVYEIAGAVLMTNKNNGKQKYFVVCRMADNAENRERYSGDCFEDQEWYVRLTSDFSGITQRIAAKMPQVDHTEFNYPEWNWG
jgi:hypothetical protein